MKYSFIKHFKFELGYRTAAAAVVFLTIWYIKFRLRRYRPPKKRIREEEKNRPTDFAFLLIIVIVVVDTTRPIFFPHLIVFQLFVFLLPKFCFKQLINFELKIYEHMIHLTNWFLIFFCFFLSFFWQISWKSANVCSRPKRKYHRKRHAFHHHQHHLNHHRSSPIQYCHISDDRQHSKETGCEPLVVVCFFFLIQGKLDICIFLYLKYIYNTWPMKIIKTRIKHQQQQQQNDRYSWKYRNYNAHI